MPRAASRLSRVVVMGPLAPFAEAYRLELLRRGYTPRSAVNMLRQVARLSRWLGSSARSGSTVSGSRSSSLSSEPEAHTAPSGHDPDCGVCSRCWRCLALSSTRTRHQPSR